MIYQDDSAPKSLERWRAEFADLAHRKIKDALRDKPPMRKIEGTLEHLYRWLEHLQGPSARRIQ